MNVLVLGWPLSRLGEGIAELCRRTGLQATAATLAESADDSCRDDPAELARWIAWAGERLGVEARPVESTAAGIAALLEQGGPAILKVGDDGEGQRGGRIGRHLAGSIHRGRRLDESLESGQQAGADEGDRVDRVVRG